MTETPAFPIDAPAFKPMAERFRGYLPVVVDVETGGFDWNKHALLEIAAVPIELDEHGRFVPGEVVSAHIEPAPGTSIDPKSLEITGIKVDHPLRGAVPEREGLDRVFEDFGAEWRFAGCSMCLGMNPDQLSPGERCASTSNRNFEGRQGKGGRTHLVSPLVAAATAVRGTLSSPADLEPVLVPQA